MNIYDSLRQMEKSIKGSEEYKRYQDLRTKITEKEETREILLDIRKKQVEVQSYLMMGQEIPEEKMKELESVNQLLTFHPTINDFLQAEYMLSKIFEDVTKSITETFNFWMPDFTQDQGDEINENN